MRSSFGWILASAGFLCAYPSWAQPTDAAHVAYDDAVEAHRQGDYARAARGFAHADRLVPNDSALRDAIVEATRAGDAALGLMLVARARRSPAHAALQEAAAKASAVFRGRAGRYRTECGQPCSVEVDGQPADPEYDGWLTVGPHVVVITSQGGRDEHRIEILPLETTSIRSATAPVVAAPIVAAPPPALPATTTAPPDRGLSPIWFWTGAGLTVALAGATAISGLDVNSQRDAFDGHRCGAVGSASCDDLASAGRSAVTRTNVLLGTAVVFGVATLVSAFFVSWKTRPTRPTTAAIRF